MDHTETTGSKIARMVAGAQANMANAFLLGGGVTSESVRLNLKNPTFQKIVDAYMALNVLADALENEEDVTPIPGCECRTWERHIGPCKGPDCGCH